MLDLFSALLHAEHEDDVVRILDAAGFDLNNDEVWVPLGSNAGNFTIVGNQQEDPSSALVEKIINSIDAVLLAECFKGGVNPKSESAPASMQQAVESFFGVYKGRLDCLRPKQHTELAQHIHVVATGEKKSPCYCVIDDGEGQTPNEFPNSFLSTTKSSPKVDINFVQGKFNAGGTGSLQFCGNHNIQLIVSRRHPDAPAAPGDDSKALWGFTVIRRRRPRKGERTSVFVYLAPGGAVPRFKADSIPVLPGPSSKGNPAPPYDGELGHGTCVKLYNYRWRASGLATLDARRELERVLQAPCLPFRISEARSGYRANYYANTVIGVWNKISLDKADAPSGQMEPGFPAPATVAPRAIGQLPVTLGVWNESVNPRHVPTGVHLLVNGQVHGPIDSQFMSRLKMDYIKQHLLVAVDCTAMDRGIAEDLFMASRDRTRKNEHAQAIRDALAEELQNHPGLRSLNAERRRRRAEKAEDDAPAVVNLLNRMIKSDPCLANLFSPGSRLVTSTGIGPPPPFKGRPFPTYFKLAKEPANGLVKTCPINRTVRVEFETDAVNDYFSRAEEPGSLEVRPSPDLIESSHLWNGRFTVRMRVPWNSQPGDKTDVTVQVSDVESDGKRGPFQSQFQLVADKPANKPNPPSGKRREHGNPRMRGRDTTNALAVPTPIEVRKEKWGDAGFEKPSDALRIKRSEDGLDFYVNVDNAALITELGQKRNDPAQIKQWFKWGLTLAALGMIRQLEENAADDTADLDKVAEACDGLARVIIPIIKVLYEHNEL